MEVKGIVSAYVFAFSPVHPRLLPHVIPHSMRNPGEVYKACHAVYCIDNVKRLCSSVYVMSCLNVAAYGFRIYVRNDVAVFVSACGWLRVLLMPMNLNSPQSIHVYCPTSFLVSESGCLRVLSKSMCLYSPQSIHVYTHVIPHSMRNPEEAYKACHAVYCIDNVKMLCSSVCVTYCLNVAVYGFRIYVRNDVAEFVSECGRL